MIVLKVTNTAPPGSASAKIEAVGFDEPGILEVAPGETVDVLLREGVALRVTEVYGQLVRAPGVLIPVDGDEGGPSGG